MLASRFLRRSLLLIFLLALLGLCGLLWLPNLFSPFVQPPNSKLTNALGIMLAFSGPQLAVQRYDPSCRLDQATYFVIVMHEEVFFPTLGISQHFSISSTMVAGRAKQEVHVEGTGPIPAGFYQYEHIICDLS